MSNEKQGGGGLSPMVLVAIIGAAATIVTACLSGIFGLIQFRMQQAPPAVQQQLAAATATGSAPAKAEFTPTSTASIPTEPAPTATVLAPTEAAQPTATLPTGILFASKINANGKALDPGTTFPADVTEIYAVFEAGAEPPGTEVTARNPQAGEYYAFLSIPKGSTLSKLGWRWIYNGTTVNEYDTDVAHGDNFWLELHNYDEGGIFNARPFGPGTYTVVILLGGNPAMSGELVIEE